MAGMMAASMALSLAACGGSAASSAAPAADSTSGASRPTWKGYGNMNSIRNLFRNSHPESHFLLKDIAAKMEKWESGTRYG